MFCSAVTLHERNEMNCYLHQGTLAQVEGISFQDFHRDLPDLPEALRRMPNLRILILDGVQIDNMESVLSGFQLPRLAMLSWRDAGGPSLPIALEAIPSAVVIDIAGSLELERLPADLQARLHVSLCSTPANGWPAMKCCC